MLFAHAREEAPAPHGRLFGNFQEYKEKGGAWSGVFILKEQRRRAQTIKHIFVGQEFQTLFVIAEGRSERRGPRERYMVKILYTQGVELS